MSLNGIMGGLQITGIGFQQYANGNAVIGCVIPQDVSVAVKYQNLFDSYLDVKYKQMHTILGELKRQGFQINKCKLSEHVTIFDGIPAYGAWECWEIIGNHSASNANGILDSISDKLIPTKF